jgi:hypothetical protein
VAIKAGDSDQKRLFLYNRMVPGAQIYARIEEIEKPWINGILRKLEAVTEPLASRADWVAALDARIEEENKGSDSSRFIAEHATHEQFRVIVREFGPDALTEAQNFFPAIARVPIKSQMAIMRVLIDEFGCGNLMQAHTYLYTKLLAELDCPTDLPSLVDGTGDAMFELLNSFYWLASRAPDVEYFLGALAYLEACIPGGFACFAAACQRLGIENGTYYTEHMHIDNFHMKEMQTAIREYELVCGLDPTKAWIGAQILSTLLGAAIDDAVAKARKQSRAGIS